MTRTRRRLQGRLLRLWAGSPSFLFVGKRGGLTLGCRLKLRKKLENAVERHAVARSARDVWREICHKSFQDLDGGRHRGHLIVDHKELLTPRIILSDDARSWISTGSQTGEQKATQHAVWCVLFPRSRRQTPIRVRWSGTALA